MARVSHPNIAAVHEVGMFHGQIYVAMEFVHGQTLGAWHRKGPASWQQVLAVYRQAAAGLAAAHEAGLVHRDFKPANAILGEDGRVRVLDFGLARADASPGGIAALERTDEGMSSLAASMESPNLDLSLTVTGTVLGTPAYMSPEQFIGKRVETKSDQFSFCVALYEALFRERPHRRPALLGVVTQAAEHGEAQPAGPSAPRPASSASPTTSTPTPSHGSPPIATPARGTACAATSRPSSWTSAWPASPNAATRSRPPRRCSARPTPRWSSTPPS